MTTLPLNVQIDVNENNFTLTDKMGFQRFLPVNGEDGGFLFKVDVLNRESHLGFKTLVKNINVSDYTEEAQERFANLSGLTLSKIKEDSAGWQGKLAAIIFNSEFAHYHELRTQ